MDRAKKNPDIACVDDTHYIHLEEIEPGRFCNSSIGPAAWDGGEIEEGWSCIGCGQWWESMPEMEQEGLAALRHMQESESDAEDKT